MDEWVPSWVNNERMDESATQSINKYIDQYDRYLDILYSPIYSVRCIFTRMAEEIQTGAEASYRVVCAVLSWQFSYNLFIVRRLLEVQFHD